MPLSNENPTSIPEFNKPEDLLWAAFNAMKNMKVWPLSKSKLTLLHKLLARTLYLANNPKQVPHGILWDLAVLTVGHSHSSKLREEYIKQYQDYCAYFNFTPMSKSELAPILYYDTLINDECDHAKKAVTTWGLSWMSVPNCVKYVRKALRVE